MNDSKNIRGEFLSIKRKELGYTQKQLAEKLNVTDKAISKWETGKGSPDISMLKPLAEALGVSVAEVLDGKEIAEDNLYQETEIKFVKEIENNHKSKRRYNVIIAIIVLLSIGTIIFLVNTISRSKVIEKKIDLYTEDVSTSLKNINLYLKKTEKCKKIDLSISMIFCDRDKKNRNILFEGYCDKGYLHWGNVQIKNGQTECTIFTDKVRRGNVEGIPTVSMETLIDIYETIDFYEIDKNNDKKCDYLLNVSDHYSETDECYLFENNNYIKLKEIDERYLNGEYTCLNISRMKNGEGSSFMSIFVKKNKSAF